MNLPIDRLRLKARRQGSRLPEPLALYAGGGHGETLHAVDQAAARLGLMPGQRLADARAILPDLVLMPATHAADRRFLEGLAAAASRYTPAVALDGADALLLDITGCAHLLGGEAGLLDDLAGRLDRLGLGHRSAIADSQALAWAWARFGAGGVLHGERAKAVMPELSVHALRLDATTTAALERLGLRRVGQLLALPQRSLVQRFGRGPVLALGRLSGVEPETFSPLREPPRFAARLSWPEPIGRTEDIEAATQELLERLVVELERAVAGARRLELWLFRVDGEVQRLTVRTGRPSRDARHLARLFALQLDGLDVGFGIETMRLEVADAASLTAEQVDLAQDRNAAELMRLVDQLRQRLGEGAVQRLVPVQSHWPERAQERVDPAAALDEPGTAWLASTPRPLRLLDRPVRIEAVAPVPDGPPRLLRRSGEALPVQLATGPERLEPEWWHCGRTLPAMRDYYRVVDGSGHDLWIYREGRYGEAVPPGWWVHGAFE